MTKNAKQKMEKRSVARIVGIVLILVIMAVLMCPQLLFFLNAQQKEAVNLFSENYFGKYLPIQDENGGFDVMRILAVVFLCLCCWAVQQAVNKLFSLIKMKNRHADTLKGLLANVIRYVIFSLQLCSA